MKKTIGILSLLGFGLVSCASSCGSCQSEPQVATSPCDGGQCTTTVAGMTSSEGGASDSSLSESADATSTLVDEVASASMCVMDTTLVCQPAENSTSVKTELVSGDTWQITLPLGLQKKPVTKTDIVLSAFLDKEKVLLVLLKEKFSGSFEQYTISSARGIKDAGATIQSSATVELNGAKFALLEAVKNDVKIWSLVTTKNGFGYGLSCGGPSPHDDAHTVCTSITNTFTLK